MNALSPKKAPQRKMDDSKTDIKRGGWIDSLLPACLRPYAYLARLDRPIGVWLLLWPALWSIALAAGGFGGVNAHILSLAALFSVGAVIMRAAGCVMNDLWDRELDQKVERTRVRPLASGAVSVRGALLFLALLLLAGLAILLQLNGLTIALGFAVIPLIIAYPLMKRITWWPQLFLGITFNFSALMGWSAVSGDLSDAPILLYVSCMFWTLGYDTIYAFQDCEDDGLAGIKSTALYFGEKAKRRVALFYGLTLFGLNWTLALLQAGTLAYLVLILCGVYMYVLIRRWDMNAPESALAAFKANHQLGFLIFIAMMCV